MNYGSVCSGIEAATAAWHPLGNSMAVPVMNWIGRRIEMVDMIGREANDNNPPAAATAAA